MDTPSQQIPHLSPSHTSERPLAAPFEHVSRTRKVVDEYVLRGADRLVYAVISSVWVVATVTFWLWWFRPDRIVTTWRFILTTFALSYDLTLMPLVFIFFLYHMKRPQPIPAQPGLRVAMVTAIVPSAESIEVLEQTVAGMLMTRYPHDTWVLDEGGDPRVRALCDEYGVNYWTRKGIAKFNQPNWPFQAKTKSGNYNSWFSEIGYANYDYLVQLDSDHIPEPEYLDEVLGYFSDPEVAYVALPSVYRNLHDWTTRGSSEQSQVFQGPIQMGYYGWAKSPMIIGSHAAYRMKHLKEIGGFAPSRAEDHLDSLRFVQAGYRGVFVPKILAEGLGPHNLSDFLAQEHQWAFSIAQVLFKFGRDKGLLTARQRTVFLFSEIWYFLYSATFLSLFLIPLLALMTNRPIVNAPLFEFILRSAPVTLTSLALLVWAYSRRLFKPGTHFFISWQGILLGFARWPIVLLAIASATISVLFRQGRFTYLVTPKGGAAMSVRTALRSLAPFLVLGLVSAFVPVIYWKVGGDPVGHAAGYVLFALVGAIAFIVILLATTVDFIKVNIKYQPNKLRLAASSLPLIAATVLLVSGTFFSGWLNRSHTLAAITYRPSTALRVTNIASPVATVIPAEESAGSPSNPDNATSAALPAVSSWLFDPSRNGVTFGAYDPSGQLSAFSGLNELFVSWDAGETGGIPAAKIRQSYTAGTPALLSVEPWPLGGRSQQTLLQDISGGVYDSTIMAEAHTIATFEQPILIRFGHEMDLTGLYPWSQNDPAAFIAAYRHVVDLYRSAGATNVLWVWSPAGNNNALAFYPGDNYVDYVGTTILEYSEWETQIAHVQTPRSYRTLIDEKYRLLVTLRKPIIISEAGVDLSPMMQQERLTEIITALPDFPAIRAVVYFNDLNALNSYVIGRPDWRLSADEIATLRTVISQQSWIEQQTKASNAEAPGVYPAPR